MFGVQVLKLLKLTVGGVDFSAIPTRQMGSLCETRLALGKWRACNEMADAWQDH
jgi:hypothetical protein